MKVSELNGALLALWVARAEGVEARHGVKLYASGPCLYKETPWGGGEPFDFRPDQRWVAGGPILERERIGSMPAVEGGKAFWIAAHPDYSDPVRGSTLLIAAMRAYVASKFGNEVTEAAHG